MTTAKAKQASTADLVHTLRARLNDERRRLEMTEAEVANLEQQAAGLRVRGTREIPAAPTLEQQVIAVLTVEAQDSAGAAAKLGVPVTKVKPIIDQLRLSGKVSNIGSDVEPRWQAALGDSCTAEELRALIYRLISWRPFTHRELVTITGARDNRVSGELANLREDRALRVVNLGNGARARWLVLPPDVKIARLPKR